MTREWPRITIAVPDEHDRTSDVVEELRRDLAQVLVSASVEVVTSDYRSLPHGDLVIAEASTLSAALECDERELSTFGDGKRRTTTIQGRLVLDRDRCHRIVIYNADYSESLRLLDVYQLATAIGAHFGHPRIDGLREVGRRIGAREVRSFSRVAAQSASYTTLEHDACSTAALLLARYLQAYDPDLTR